MSGLSKHFIIGFWIGTGEAAVYIFTNVLKLDPMYQVGFNSLATLISSIIEKRLNDIENLLLDKSLSHFDVLKKLWSLARSEINPEAIGNSVIQGAAGVVVDRFIENNEGNNAMVELEDAGMIIHATAKAVTSYNNFSDANEERKEVIAGRAFAFAFWMIFVIILRKSNKNNNNNSP